jgi:hypothetical protein
MLWARGSGANVWVVMSEGEPKKLADDTIATLRQLAHELSNAIENIMQASYLIAQSKNEHNSKWIELIDSATSDAARINREIREILRSQS